MSYAYEICHMSYAYEICHMHMKYVICFSLFSPCRRSKKWDIKVCRKVVHDFLFKVLQKVKKAPTTSSFVLHLWTSLAHDIQYTHTRA